MTIEEAIKELKRHISPYKNCKADADANDAIATAIKSLEAWEKIRKIYDEKAHNVKVRYIHDLQIWADARDIIDKYLSEVSE